MTKLLSLILVMIVKSLLRNQKNYPNPKNYLNQEKSR